VASNKFADAAGNINADGADADNVKTISVNTIRPTIAVTAAESNLKAGESSVVSFSVSETVTDFLATDITSSGGTISNFAGTGTSYTATFTPTVSSTANGVVSVASNKFTNAAGNQNTDGSDGNNTKTFSVDTLLPLADLSPNKTLLKIGATSTITITLSESSTDFALEDLTVTGGALSSFSGSGTNYSVIFTPNAANGTLSLANAKFSDAAGNQNADGLEANNNLAFVYDTVLPTIAITNDKGSLKAGETSTLTLTLSEPSADFGVTSIQTGLLPTTAKPSQLILYALLFWLKQIRAI